MKTHTNSYKENIAKFGRELDSKITYTLNNTEMELGMEQLNSISPHYDSAILKSTMKQLDIDSNVEIPVGTILTYEFAVKSINEYEYISFGNYVVKDVEKQEDTSSYKITCYDKMLYAMRDYETPKILTDDVVFSEDKKYYEKINNKYSLYIGETSVSPVELGLYEEITYPITIRDYINALCGTIDLTFANSNDTFANYDKEISKELYINNEGNTLGYTFRDVLDELAEVTASTICINEDDELEIRYINNLLPSDYKQVEYIETNNHGNYISTGFYATKNTKLEICYKTIGNFSQNPRPNFCVIAGSYDANNNKGISIGCTINTTGLTPRFDGKTFEIPTSTDNTILTDISSKDGYYRNGTRINNWGTTNEFTTNYPIMLFTSALSSGNVTSWQRNARIYYCKIYENDELMRDMIPCYRISDNEIGFYDLVNDVFYTNQGSGTFAYGNVNETAVDTIDEEYLKNINVNFGEKFGPVNTIVLSRSGNADKIAQSIPSDLQDENKVAIEISDNQIMNDNNRADFMPSILQQLYGLEYYINDFSSTGITYLDLCDRYNVKIGDNTYSCIMFNDEVNITQGLEENIHTDMLEESDTEYKYTSSDDRKVNQAYIIVKKNEGTIESVVSSVNEINGELNEVKAVQTDTTSTIDIISTHISRENGDVTEVTTTTGFTFNADGMTIHKSDSDFYAVHDETGTYYYDGGVEPQNIVGQYTKSGSKQKDLALFGVYYYGMDEIDDTPMFVAQLYTDKDGERCFGHFYNGGDY